MSLVLVCTLTAETYETSDYRDKKQRASILLEHKEYKEALDLFSELQHEGAKDNSISELLASACNGYSVELIESGDYLASLYYLNKALELSPESTTIRENISVAYYRLGRTYEEEKKLDDSIQCFHKALEFNPALESARDMLGLIYYNYGVRFYREREYRKAEDFLLKALEYKKSSHAAIYEVLGDSAYFQQELQKAEKLWKQGVEDVSATEEEKASLGAKLLKLHTEIEEELRLAVYRSDKFIIRYEKEGLEESAYKIATTLQSAYRIVGRYFNYFPKAKTTVIIYNARIFAEKSENAHSGIRAMYDGKIRLPALDNKTDLITFKSLLWHEYTHALVYELAGHTCPIWLNEGLAQTQEASIVPIQTLVLPHAVQNKKTLSFSDFFSQYEKIPDGIDVRLFYEQAYSMTQFLLKRHQLYKIKTLLKDLKKGKPFDLAFKNTFYLTQEQFERQWLKSLE
jgi:tetratricopeptide (TPR) repeat protein